MAIHSLLHKLKLESLGISGINSFFSKQICKTLFFILILNSIGYSQNLFFNSTRYYFPNYNSPASDFVTTYSKGYAVVGTVEYDNNNTIPFVMYCDSVDQQIWTRPYTTFGAGFTFNRVIQLPDSSLIVVGKMFNPIQGDFGAACLRISATGEEIWKVSIGNNEGQIFEANDVILVSDSTILIVGTEKNTSSFLIKLNLDGTKNWSKSFIFEDNSPINFQELVAVKELSNGHFILSGTTNYGGANQRGYFFETNENGDLLWLKRLAQFSIISDLAIDTNGILIRCFSQSADVLKFDFEGNLQWAKRFISEDFEDGVFPKFTRFSDGTFGFCGAGFSVGSLVRFDSNGNFKFGATIFGKSTRMLENEGKVYVLNNGPVFGIKIQGMFDKHFAVGTFDGLLIEGSAISTESCVFDNNFTSQTGFISTINDTMVEHGQLLVYPAMMELLNSTFEQSAACVDFFGNVDELSTSKFEIFPNPFLDEISLKSEIAIGENYSIYNQNGILLSNGVIDNKVVNLSLDFLDQGVYYIQVKNEVKRLVKL